MKDLINKKRQSGFTIIEVMIVLAIAGLIMTIVFIAVPQLQRGQRNAARKDVMNRIKTEVDNYSSNNSGGIPTANNNINTGFLPTGGFYVRYISSSASSYNDPKTGTNMIQASSNWTSDATITTATVGRVYYGTNRICDSAAPENSTNTGAGGRNYVLMGALEGGARYCLDNK